MGNVKSRQADGNYRIGKRSETNRAKERTSEEVKERENEKEKKKGREKKDPTVPVWCGMSAQRSGRVSVLRVCLDPELNCDGV
jgi:hypothetical protein